MNIKRISALIMISCSTGLVLAPSAQAATFTTNVSQSTDPKANIWLQSITQKNNQGKDRVFYDFSFVNKVTGLTNAQFTGGNTGAASTDKGDNASIPKSIQVSEDPKADEIAAYLSNNNLNNIIDTEDQGAFIMNLWFDTTIRQDSSGLDNLFFWERGQNSDLRIQAIDEKGNLLGNFLKLTKQSQKSAGYKIDTTEIDVAQDVGSWGVSLKELGLSNEQAAKGIQGIQVLAENDFNGPEFKVSARRADLPQSVPEPSTTAALGVLAVGALKLLKKKLLVQL